MELLVPLITLYVALLLIRPLRTRARTETARQQQPATRVLKDTELGLASLKLPVRWRTATALNDQAAVQATDPLRQRFAVVISEPREDFDVSVDLSDHAGRTLAQLADSLRLVAINGPIERTVNGCRALQFEVEGYHQGVRLVYLHTTLEGRRAYHQVLVWSTRSAYDRQLFDELVDGFEELPGPEPSLTTAPTMPVEAQVQSRYAYH
jgi:hypothetical protein